MNLSLFLSSILIAVSAVDCRDQQRLLLLRHGTQSNSSFDGMQFTGSTPSPSPPGVITEDDSLPSLPSASTTTPISDNNILPSHAFHSKMSPTLMLRMNPSSATPNPSPGTSTAAHSTQSSQPSWEEVALPLEATQVVPTTSPLEVTDKSLSFTSARSFGGNDGGNDISFSDTQVWCTSEMDSTDESYRTIEIPYYYQIEAMHGDVSRSLVRPIESMLLAALAENMLECSNTRDGAHDEGIRRLGVLQLGTRVFAAYSLPDETVSNEYTCTNSKARSCHIVQAQINLLVGGGDGSHEDEDITSKAYTAIRLALLAFGDQDVLNIHYIGNNPISLSSPSVNELTKREDMSSEEGNRSMFATIFLLFLVCGCLGAILLLIAFLRTYGAKRGGTSHVDEALADDAKSSGVPSTICITVTSSTDGLCELVGIPVASSRHDSLTDDETAEQSHGVEVGEDDWCRFVYMQSVELSRCASLARVPEESSIGYGCDDEEGSV